MQYFDALVLLTSIPSETSILSYIAFLYYLHKDVSKSTL